MRLVVEEKAASAVRRGHPWVYREALGRGKTPRTGDAVELVDGRGQALGVGLYDERSPIAVRVYGRPGARESTALDETGLARAVERAVAARDRLFDPKETSALRLCHGEGDRVPG